jgi:molybdopterin-guanine dinucleotide biosynthesis protein A
MKNFVDFTLNKDAICLDALLKLDNEKSNQTLFILNENEKLIGTLTDGDIRRGLIKGLNLNSPIHLFCYQNFSFIKGEIDVLNIRRLKKEGIKVLPRLNEKGQIEKVYDLSKLKSILPVHAVIMAGGRGERLRPLTDKTPKSMLSLGEKPIIEHNIDHLISYGVETITISVRYLSDQIINYFGDGNAKGISIDYIKEEMPHGTIGCLAQIRKSDLDTILVMNSDIFTNIDLEDFYLAFKDANADMAVASIPYSVDIPYAIMELNENCITSFKEKPKNTYYANAGIYLIKLQNASLIPKNSFYDATDLMDSILSNNGKLIHNRLLD